MTAITDNGFARIDKTSIIRNPSNSGALTGNDIAYNSTTTINEKIDSVVAGGGGNTAIQFDDEGIALGTAGTVSEVDFVGAGVTATRSLNKVTVTIPGGGGGGDLSSNTATSVDGEVMLFNGTTGKSAKRGNTLTGLYKLVSGIFTTATNADLPVMSATVGGAVPTPPNDASKFLNGQGAFTVPAGGGDMVLASAQTVTGVKTFLDGILGLRNVANTFTSFFTNTNTASRTYTLKDASGTLAFTSDITGTNSGTNTGDETTTRIGTLIDGSTNKTTPVDADQFAIRDSVGGLLQQVTLANLKAVLKTYFDSLTTTLTNKTLTAPVIATIVNTGTLTLPTSTDTLVGRATTDTLTNKTLTTPTIASVKGTVVTDTDGATITFDKNAGDYHRVVLGGNRTLAISNMAAGDRIVIDLVQDATGSRTVTWFTTIKWVGGTVPTLTTAVNKIDTFGFICTSAGNYQGYIIGQNL